MDRTPSGREIPGKPARKSIQPGQFHFWSLILETFHFLADRNCDRIEIPYIKKIKDRRHEK